MVFSHHLWLHPWRLPIIYIAQIPDDVVFPIEKNKLGHAIQTEKGSPSEMSVSFGFYSYKFSLADLVK